jgi:hypothetical protein
MIAIVEAHYGMAGLSCEDGVNEALTGHGEKSNTLSENKDIT